MVWNTWDLIEDSSVSFELSAITCHLSSSFDSFLGGAKKTKKRAMASLLTTRKAAAAPNLRSKEATKAYVHRQGGDLSFFFVAMALDKVGRCACVSVSGGTGIAMWLQVGIKLTNSLANYVKTSILGSDGKSKKSLEGENPNYSKASSLI